MRIGFGNDIHRLVEGRPLMLGGIEIPSDKGEDAHSDGDVLLHAIADAILGAKALGDIGKMFPDNSPYTKDMPSSAILKSVQILSGARIVNIDSTITLEKPKLAEHIEAIRKSIAGILEIDVRNISVKAKTAEGLGPIVEGKAIKAEAVVLIG